MMKRLAIVTTHPIQYNAPWFKLLAKRGLVSLKVFYTWSQIENGPKYDPDFKKIIEWDVPLLEGYDYEFIENVSLTPGSHHFKGINNPALIKAIESFKPDALLVIGWAYKSHLGCMRYFKNKIPILFRGDSTLLDEKKGIKTFLRRRFLRWVYKHVDKALYAGANNKKYFTVHGLKENQLIKALHAIDNDRFSTANSQQEDFVKKARNILGINESDFVILFAGKLEEKKNPFFILDLAKRIQGDQMIFLFIGNGHLEAELKSASKNDTRIKFLDFQNQSIMPAVYRLASVFILPSKGPGETWGLAANEAMANGIPVILSAKAGGALDLVENNGLVFEPSQIEDVQAYIEKLKNSKELYNKTSKESLNHIKKFTFARIADAVELACMQ